MTFTAFPAPDPATRSANAPGDWVIRWGDHSLSESEVTGEHLALLVLLNGEDTWADCDLSDIATADPTIGPARLISWITVMVAVAEQLEDFDELSQLIAGVRAASATDIISSLHRH